MRKELLVTKRILAGMAAGLVLFIYAAIPSMAKQANTEDDPREIFDVEYTSSSGETSYLELGGLNNDFWAYLPFDAYWHNEGMHELDEPIHDRNRNWICMDQYYSGEGRSETPRKVQGAFSPRLLMGFRLYTDDEWQITRLEEKTEGDVVTVVYQLNAHTGDTVSISSLSYMTIGPRGNKGCLCMNDPEYDPQWAVETSETVAFYTNVHPARQNEKWIDGCEKYSWPEEFSDGSCSGMIYTITEDDDVIYADALAKMRFDNKYTETVVNAKIYYRFKVINIDKVNNAMEAETSNALSTAGEDEGTDISTDIVEGDDFTPSTEDDDSWLSDDSWFPEDFENPFEELEIDEELPRAVGTGAAGAAVAAGAVGAAGAAAKASGKKKSKNKEKKKEEKKEDKRSTYKMYVYKDFGDTLKRGDEEKFVYARIEETTWDKRVFTNEKLTSQISVSSMTDALIVSDAGMTVNGYKAASVVAPKEVEKSKGTVTFQFTGEGGVFTRNVVFNIVGENPYIIYPKLGDDGSSWLESNQPGEAVFIAGQGGEGKVMFYIKDAVEEPIDIDFDAGPDFDVTYQKEEKYKCGYYAVIQNLSKEMEKGNGIIADKVIKTIGVAAKFKDGSVTNSEFYVELYPDGLSVVPNTKYFKDDMFQVNTVAKDKYEPGEIPIMPSSFDVLVCYADSRTGEPKIFRNPSLICGDLDDEGKYGNTFKVNFEYWIDYTTAGGYAFYPKVTLPMFDQAYNAKMKLKYSGKGGISFEGDLPIAFLGEMPTPPGEPTTREWQIERLKKNIRDFGLEKRPCLMIMLSNLEFYSGDDIKFVRKYVILIGIHFYTYKNRVEMNYAEVCDHYIAGCSALMKSGDYAFSFVMQRWFGQAGKVAASVINPFKNLFAEWIGSKVGKYLDSDFQGNPDLDFMNSVFESFEGGLTELMTAKKKPTPDQMGYIVSFYLMSCYLRHYYKGEGREKGDVYRSILAALGDLTITKLKAALSESIEKHSKKLMEKVAKWFGDRFKDWFGEATQRAVEAAKKQGFADVMRESLKKGATHADVVAAEAATKAAGELQKEVQSQFMDYSAGQFAEMTTESIKLTTGVILNFVLHGYIDKKSASSAEPLEIILDFFMNRYGIKPENTYKLTQYTVGVHSIRVNEKGNLIIGIDDMEMEFSVVNNFQVFFDMFYTFITESIMCMFSDEPRDFNNAPDYRDNMPCDTTILDKTLNELDNAKEVKYTYVGWDS